MESRLRRGNRKQRQLVTMVMGHNHTAIYNNSNDKSQDYNENGNADSNYDNELKTAVAVLATQTDNTD